MWGRTASFRRPGEKDHPVIRLGSPSSSATSCLGRGEGLFNLGIAGNSVRRFQRVLHVSGWTRGSRPLLRLPVAGYSPVGRRVLMVVPTMARCGCERRLISTAEGIEQGIRRLCSVLEHLPHGAAAFEEEFKKLGAEFMDDPEPDQRNEWPNSARANRVRRGATRLCMRFKCSRPPYAGRPSRSHRAIRSSRPEIVHGWGDHAATVAGAAACLLGAPRVIVGQTNIAPVHHAGGGAASTSTSIVRCCATRT